MSRICRFQLLKCKALPLFFVIYDSKWKVFGFWAAVGQQIGFRTSLSVL